MSKDVKETARIVGNRGKGVPSIIWK
jgi:hypothetical protein